MTPNNIFQNINEIMSILWLQKKDSCKSINVPNILEKIKYVCNSKFRKSCNRSEILSNNMLKLFFHLSVWLITGIETTSRLVRNQEYFKIVYNN